MEAPHSVRILIVCHFFPPINAIASLRPYSWAKYWSRMGHEVVVLTTVKPPSAHPLKFPREGFSVVEVPSLYNSVRALVKKGRAGGIFQELGAEERKEGLVSRLLGYFQNKYGIFWNIRMPDHLDFWIWPAARAARRLGRFDLVVSTFGPYASHLVAYLVKRSQGCKWIADYRDLWTDSYVYPGLWPFKAVERMLERKLLASADAITSVARLEAEVLRKAYGRYVHIVENGFDIEDLKGLSTEPFFPQDGKIRIVYTGSFYAGKRDPSPLFLAIRKLEGKHPGLEDKLEVVVAGVNLHNLEEFIESHGVKKYVRLQGFVSRPDALRMQRDADALLLLEWEDPVASMLTGKVFEYLFSGRPVLLVGAGPESPAGKLITEVERGFCLGNDVERIASVLNDLLNGRPIMVAPPDERLAAYTREALAGKMLALVSEKSRQEMC